MDYRIPEAWFATEERMHSLTKRRVFSDRGILETRSDGLEFHGKKHDFRISMSDIQSVSPTTQRVPWVAWVIPDTIATFLVGLALAIGLRAPGSEKLVVLAICVAILLAFNTFAILLTYRTMWTSVEYQDEQGNLSRLYFADRASGIHKMELLEILHRWANLEKLKSLQQETPDHPEVHESQPAPTAAGSHPEQPESPQQQTPDHPEVHQDRQATGATGSRWGDERIVDLLPNDSPSQAPDPQSEVSVSTEPSAETAASETILADAAHQYGVAESQFKSLPGGHFAHVYEFSMDGRACVLRVTPPNDEIDERAMRATLEWMRFLRAHGAPVPGPLPSRRGNLIEQDGPGYLIVAFERARGVRAETLPVEQWSDGLYRSLGQAVGKMHALAKQYVPPDESLRRPEWDRIGNCFNPTPGLDASQAVIREKREHVLATIQALPKDREGYGLIHTDLHLGNFSVDAENNGVTLLDFDDCAYGWYAMDVAMTLFDMLVLYPGPDKENFAARFMQHYLNGYQAENSLSFFWLAQLPHFLRLLEIGVYTQVYRGYDPNDYDSWVGKFMVNREYRIENDVPYVGPSVGG